MRIPRMFAIALLLPALCPAGAGPSGSWQAIDPPTPAPGFELPDLDGDQHRQADYRGRILVVNFWATWCTPCREEMPSLERLHRALQDEGVTVVAINMGDARRHVAAFDREARLSFPLLIDPSGEVARHDWRIRGLPTTFIVGAEGRILYRLMGANEWDSPGTIERLRELSDQR